MSKRLSYSFTYLQYSLRIVAAQHGLLAPHLLVLFPCRLLHLPCGDAFLLGTAVIVLVLDFEERGVAVKIRAYPDFFSDATPCMVHAVHLVVFGIEIGRVVFSDAFVTDLLDEILPFDSSEEGD